MINKTALIYEDINDAISRMVNGNPMGISLKQIAMELWPSRNPNTARSALSRAMSSDYKDMRLSPQELDKLMEITGRPEDIIFFLCDKYSYERPAKKDKVSFEREIRSELKSLIDTLRHVKRKVEQLERMK